MDFLDMDEEQSLHSAPPHGKNFAGQLSRQVQDYIDAGDVFGAIRAYRQETRASLAVALATVKLAMRKAKR